MEEFEYKGKWWLPEKPEKEITGILKFHPTEGAELELLDSFETSKRRAMISNPYTEQAVILGITSNGKIITLYRCYRYKIQPSMAGPQMSSFKADFVFEGHHFERAEDIMFDSISVNYSHLEDWAEIPWFHPKRESNSESHLTKLKVDYSFPQKVEVKLDSVTISFDYYLNSNCSRTELNLKQVMFLKIEPREQTHFANYLDDICYHIQNFLSLAMSQAIYPLAMKGRTKARGRISADGRLIYNPISIFRANDSFLNLSGKIRRPKMLFSFKEISHDFEACLNNWFTKSEILKPVYDLYFGTLYNPSIYLEHEFLSLSQAIESYHRRVYGGQYLSNDDYEEIRKILTEAIPRGTHRDFRESLKQRLKYHNEFSLRKRLKDVLNKCGDLAGLLVHDHKKFIDDVVNTRNFLTHYDKKLKAKAKSGTELLKLIQKMKFVIELCLLMELGISSEKIKAIVSRNQKYLSLSRNL